MVKKVKRIELLFITLIVLFSFLIRIAYIDEVPVGLYTDEVISAYDAYSILLTGKDSHGEFLPLYFTTIGDYRDPIHIYSMIPFIFLFGTTDLGARFASVFYGTLTVLVTYFLAKEMFNEKVALLSSFFVSISPWHFIFSRIAFHAITAPFFFVLGLYFLVKGIKDKKFIIAGLAVLALSIYTYYPMRLFVPLFLLGFLLIYRKEFVKLRKYFFIGGLVAFFILVPAIVFHLKEPQKALARYNTVSIFNQGYFDEIKNIIWDKKPIPDEIKNSSATYALIFIHNYFQHLSPNFLFFKGDQNQRHNVNGFGKLYVFQIPLVLFGIAWCIKNRGKPTLLILLWLLTFPVASSLTFEGVPHSIRTIMAIPVFEILSAIGAFFIITLYSTRKTRLGRNFLIVLTLLFILVAAVNVYYFFYNYFRVYPTYSYDSFGSRLGEAIVYANSIKDNYEEVIIINKFFGDPNFYTAFYTGYNPALFQANNYFVKSGLIGRFCIALTTDCKLTGKVLYVLETHHSFLKDLGNETVKKIFYNPDNSQAFRVSEGIFTEEDLKELRS